MYRLTRTLLAALVLLLAAPAPGSPTASSTAHAQEARGDRQTQRQRQRPKPRTAGSRTAKPRTVKPQRPRPAPRKAKAPKAPRQSVLGLLKSHHKGSLYRAARLYDESGANPFKGMKAGEQKALHAQLQRALASAPRGRAGRAAIELQKRSGASTLLLALAEAAPAGPARATMIDSYIEAMAAEPSSRLAGHMFLNLSVRPKLLRAEHKQKLEAVRERVLPSRPPYADWFRGDRRKLNVRHYIQPEFWRDELRNYRQNGWTLGEERNGTLVVTRTLKDPAGKHPDVEARAVLRKTADRFFRDMDDADVHVAIYSGHSELGGNISDALVTAPHRETGTKLVMTFMCRGKQNLFELSRRYPRAHILTTDQASYSHQDTAHLAAFYEGLARRATYGEMSRTAELGGRKNYIWPDDMRQLAHRDLDNDGHMDPRGIRSARHVERLFNVERKVGRGERTALKPEEPPADLSRLSGTKIHRAVNFARTLWTYHVEYNPRGKPAYPKKDVGERIVSRGWYRSEGKEVARVHTRRAEGKQWIEVEVNARYHNVHPDVLGPAIIYEIATHLGKEKYGHTAQQEAPRALSFAADYIQYMVFDKPLARESLRALTEHFGLPPVTHEQMSEALSVDPEAYGSARIVRAMEEAMGQAQARVTR